MDLRDALLQQINYGFRPRGKLRNESVSSHVFLSLFDPLFPSEILYLKFFGL